MRYAGILLIAASVCVASSVRADERDRQVEAAVKACVAVVRETDGGAGFNSNFDAFYNVATKRVENNVTTQYGVDSLFPFLKCMAAYGFPVR